MPPDQPTTLAMLRRRPRLRPRLLLGSSAVWGLWLLAAGVVIWLSLRTALTGGVPGLVAEASQHLVLSPESGRLDELLVRPGDTVIAGQVLGRLEDGPLAAQVAAIGHRLDALDTLLASVGAVGAAREAEAQAQQCERDRQRLETRLRSHDARRAQTADRAELAVIEQQTARLEPLVARGVVRDDELRPLTQRAAVLRARLALSNPAAGIDDLAQSEATGTVVALTRAELLERRANLMLERLTLQQELRRLEAEREQLTLMAPVAGRVVEVIAKRGLHLEAGTPVAAILSDGPPSVTAWVTPATAPSLQPGQAMQVLRPSTGTEHPATISRVGLAAVDLPAALQLPGTRPRRGVPVILALETDVLVPGERVLVQNHPDAWW